ncbi:Transposase IS4 [Popillia japonica]|uniref:Transposase IS4 n=1 Tax=Popillia japonica TaxID=7064 RepID=A0AAW1L8B9_POPJA
METDSDYEPSEEDELEQSGSSCSEDESSDVKSDGEEYEDLIFQATQWCEIDATLPISPAPPPFPFEELYSVDEGTSELYSVDEGNTSLGDEIDSVYFIPTIDHGIRSCKRIAKIIMGRFYKRKHNRVPISEEIIKSAIREVIRDKKSIRVTAAKYAINKSTLFKRIKFKRIKFVKHQKNNVLIDESANSSDDDFRNKQILSTFSTFSPTPGISSNINFEEDINNYTLQFFNLFFDDELVNEIALQTNIYAGQVRTEGNAKSQWRDVTSNEIRLFLAINIMQSVVKKPLFLAINIMQSVVKKPDLQDYWSRNPIIETPFVRKMMPYKRFVTIKQYLHFSDNAKYDPKNHPSPKLYKIWPIVSDLSQKFSKFYTPERDITIDESLLLYKGRLGWVQYIPLKGARFGIKSSMLCESKSGYLWGYII